MKNIFNDKSWFILVQLNDLICLLIVSWCFNSVVLAGKYLGWLGNFWDVWTFLPFWCVFYVRQAIKTAVRDLVLHGIVSQSNRPSINNGVRFYDCCSNINCRLSRSKLVLLWAVLTKIYPRSPHLSNLFP